MPESGKALLVLGALVAVMMLADMRPIHKGIYVFLILGLVLTENRALDSEHKVSADKEVAQREQQNKQFQAIADGIGASVRQSQAQFTATMDRINATLETSERTFRNTEPYAALEFKDISVDPPSLPLAIDHQLTFNVHFTNGGNDPAKYLLHASRIYIRKPDDLDSEREIADDFDKEWKISMPNSSKLRASVPVSPNALELFSFRSDPIKKSEYDGIQDHTLTLYVLIRFSWTDHIGRWLGDECFSFQDARRNLTVTHPCHFHHNPRYKDTN